jgi:predicted permease
MNPIRRRRDVFILRLRSLFFKGRVERDLQRELEYHIDQEARQNIHRGMTPPEARQAAIRRLGGIAQVQEDCRDMRNVRNTNHVETLLSDISYAVRMLRRSPGFAAMIILTMGLSIGANTAIFSAIEGVLLRPLPYPSPDRLARIFLNSDHYPRFPVNPYDLRDFRARNTTFDSLAGIVPSDLQISGIGDPVKLTAFRVTADYFRVLGYAPERGRDFTTDDELPARGRIVILSNHLWRNLFQSDSGIIGRSIMLNAQPYTVVGVMPAGLQHPGNEYHSVADGDTVDLWYPFTYDGDPNNRGSHYMEVIGRLKPGVTPAQAQSDLAGVLSQLGAEHPNDRGWRLLLVPLYTELVGRTSHMLLIILGAVVVLLLIACINSANLLLARSSVRTQEFAVRAALGAGRSRIFRQLLTESMVIALAGGGLGIVLAVVGVKALVAFLPAGFPRAAEVRMDPTVLAFTLVVAVTTGLLFGLAPGLAASRLDVQSNLREGGRGATGGGRQLRLRNLLVAGETGLACVLLIAAGLMLRSFVNLVKTDPGFRPEHVLTASVSLPRQGYGTDPAVAGFAHRLVEGLQSAPGMELAAVGSDLPWTGYDENIGGFTVEGRDEEYSNHTTACFHSASPDYFQALGIRLLAGRFFTEHDDTSAPNVIIVNNAMASRYWPNEYPIGKRISLTDQPKEKDWISVVGVVGDIKDEPDKATARPAFWMPMSQNPSEYLAVVVRSDLTPAEIISQVRSTVRGIDGGLAVADIRLMDQVVDASFSSRRFSLFLVGLFAGLALVLAAIGIYGVISYSVGQRMHEFGIRMALGAKRTDLLRMVLGQGLTLAGAGAVLGLLCGVGLNRLLGALLYGVSGTDPITFAAVGVMIVSIAALACYVPARRAATVDPMGSLRRD